MQLDPSVLLVILFFPRYHTDTHFQQRMVSSLQECRKPHINPPLKASSPNWAIPGFSWVAKKACHQAEPQMFPTSDGVCGRYSSAEKEAEEIKHLKEVCFPVWLCQPDHVSLY